MTGHARDGSGGGANSNVLGSVCHLARDECAARLTRLELGFMRISKAFESWVIELHKQTKGPQLSFEDIAMLHAVRLRGGSATLGELLIFQHRYDLSAIQYSVKKLQALGLLRKVRGGSKREVAYELTLDGHDITERYAELREQALVQLCAGIPDLDRAMPGAAETIERLIGVYDLATQSLLNTNLLRQRVGGDGTTEAHRSNGSLIAPTASARPASQESTRRRSTVRPAK